MPVGPPCDCGRGLQCTAAHIWPSNGTADSAVGRKAVLDFQFAHFLKIPSVAQFQIAPMDDTEIEVRIVDQPLNLNECAEITSGLTRQIGTAFTES